MTQAFDDRLVESLGGVSALLPDFLTPSPTSYIFPQVISTSSFLFSEQFSSAPAYCLSGLPTSLPALLRENKGLPLVKGRFLSPICVD